MKFLSIGECMMELAPHENGLYSVGFAGDTFNTAWYVAQLSGSDVQTLYYTAVGDDRVSAQMVDFMKLSGVDPLAKVRAGKSVGLYMISLDNGERSFSYWRDTAAAKTLADDDIALPIGKGDIAYFSGITLAILPPAGRAKFLQSLENYRSTEVRIVFDPNLRPRLWSSQSEMLEWTTKGAAVADICLPSFEDEATYFGDATPKDTCNRYVANGSQVVVAKNGPLPIVAVENGSFYDIDVEPVTQPVDTTAAGDSFNAQFCLQYFSGAQLAEAAKQASRVSAKVISKPSALVDLWDLA